MQRLIVILFFSLLFSNTGHIPSETRKIHNPLVSGQIDIRFGCLEEATADIEGTDFFPDNLIAIDKFHSERYDIPNSLYHYHHSNIISLGNHKLLPYFIDLPPPGYL